MHKHFVESRDPHRNRKITGILLLLLLGGFLIQFMGGLFAHSSSVMSDAFHMLVDGTSQLVYWLVLTIAVWSKLPPRLMTRRFPVLMDAVCTWKTSSLWKVGDFVCAILLFAAASYTIFSSIQRLAYPQSIQLEISFPVVVLGLMINLVNLLVIVGNQAKDDLKGVLLHVKSDLYHSIIILIGQLVVWCFGSPFSFIDSLLGLWLGGKMMKWSGGLLKETMRGKRLVIKGILIYFPVLVESSCGDHEHVEGTATSGVSIQKVVKDHHSCSHSSSKC